MKANQEYRKDATLLLGLVLYLIFTADLPTEEAITTSATYADDAALLSVHEDPVTVSRNLQRQKVF